MRDYEKVILLRRPHDEKSEVVLCKHGNDFVTWYRNYETNYCYWGNYFLATKIGLKDAIKDFEERGVY